VAQVIRLGPKVGGRLALVLHSSDEPGELLLQLLSTQEEEACDSEWPVRRAV